ncbi:MAG: ornithine aminomutase subunit alpha [Defluviitaleaceae bacterium]|nr:ornithine aminomutase subunit alpha [Defluviitaleaceae bacterium]
MKRNDDFELRRAHLKDLTDEQLQERFWQLTGQVVDPLLKLGYENTTPAIERSVLLRMGFSSLEVKEIVEGALKRGLLGHGAGNLVYKLSKKKNIPIREAGLLLAEGKDWEAAV